MYNNPFLNLSRIQRSNGLVLILLIFILTTLTKKFDALIESNPFQSDLKHPLSPQTFSQQMDETNLTEFLSPRSPQMMVLLLIFYLFLKRIVGQNGFVLLLQNLFQSKP